MSSKRAFDVVFAAFALTALTPLLLLVAALILVDSGRPVLFRQTRVGWRGRDFKIYKFRTMVVEAEQIGPSVTTHEDARITRAGKYLRRTRIDELPQFLNVLAGDMSVVGPRPEVRKYFAHYSSSDAAIVLSVRPGITDPTAIEFRNEAEVLAMSPEPERTYVEQVMPVKIRKYRQYVAERSFFGDLAVIWRTARVVWIRGK